MTAGQQLVTVADVNGCALCGLPESRHPVLGFGHMDDVKRKVVTTKAFKRPSLGLIGARIAHRQSNGYPIAEVHPVTGEPTTHFVTTACRCGAKALATPEQAATARCESCIREDVR